MKDKTVAIIDLGSNSIRLVMYKITNTENYQETLNLKKSARLSMYVDHHNNITAYGIKVIIDILNYFKELVHFHHVEDVYGVATAVFRKAPNRKDVLRQIQKKTNFTFDILTGEQEAYYGYLAVVNSVDIRDGLTIDIGGGSIEISLFSNRKLRHTHSFSFGAITLTKQFVQNEKPTKKEMNRLSKFLYEQFNALEWIIECQYPVVGIGGSARNLSHIHQHIVNYPLVGIHQYEILPKDIIKINKRLTSLTLKERKNIDGLSKDRTDIIIPAIETIYQLTQVAKAPLFIMSSKGIRDGLFYRKILNKEKITIFPNVLQENLFQMINKYGLDLTHTSQIENICTQLFQGIVQKRIFPLHESDLTLLKHGANLHDIGEFFNYESKSEHTFNILKNNIIEGFSHVEQIQIALIASFKSREYMKRQLRNFSGWFSSEQLKKIELLGSLIKISYGLERSKRQLTKKVIVTSSNKKSITFHVIHVCDNRFEREYVQYHKKHLEKVINRNVSFTYEQISI